MAELLPCPFCGGEADTYEYEAEQNIYDPSTLGYVDTEYYTKYMEIDYSTLANIGKIISQYSNV